MNLCEGGDGMGVEKGGSEYWCFGETGGLVLIVLGIAAARVRCFLL